MYRITQCLSVGRFPSPERAAELLAAGVTHILNVSDACNPVVASDGGFREIAWHPFDDSRRIPEADALAALDTLHRMVSEPGAHVYVHCLAGHLRSPTILWLYLIACGLDAASARDLIEERSPDAAPGARKLVGPDLVLRAQLHGLANYFPLTRGEVIVPVEKPSGPAG